MKKLAFVASMLFAVPALAQAPAAKPATPAPAAKPATPPAATPATPAAKDAKPAMPAPPPAAPEVKATVDAFVGKWAAEGTATIPGQAEPHKMKAKIDCKPAAMKTAALCMLSGTGSMGKMEQAVIVAYSNEDKMVHFMAAGSMGEVHDHHCTWKDPKTLACAPLKTMHMGQPATEELTMTWADPKTMTHKSVTTLKDGSKIVFEAVGKRK